MAKLPDLSLSACCTDCIVMKPRVGVLLRAVMVLRVWNCLVLAASVTLEAFAGELPLKSLPEVVLSEVLP